MQPDEDKPNLPRKLPPRIPRRGTRARASSPARERREQPRLFEPEHYLELADVAIRENRKAK
jgi:hypothetical protein